MPQDYSSYTCYKCGMKGHTSNWPDCPANVQRIQEAKKNAYYGNGNGGVPGGGKYRPPGGSYN